MKTIIAPVDFSDAALNALSFAAELSKRASARLLVINVSEKDREEEKIKNKLKLIESDLEKNFGPDLQFESLVAHGDLISTLKKMMANYQPDLIVMGTKGASGLKKMLIGSNTVNVIANTNIPVLVIPEAARFKNFNGRNRIVLATDLELLENDAVLDILKEIALFIEEPKLRVISVRPKYTTLPDLKRLERDHLVSFFSSD
ncbi:MAG TPA: universal stress protein, partial [Chitinophagaceae bacterium]